MDLPSPASLADLLADGWLVQADVDATWASLGQVTGVEFNDDTIRLHTRAGTRDLPGREVARVVDGRWTWTQIPELDIPELHEPEAAFDELLRAARTLHGNVPVLLAPFPDGLRAVAVEFRPAPGPIRSTLTHGLAQLPPLLDARRALLSFAAARGLGIRSEADAVGLSDGTVVGFEGPRPVSVTSGEGGLRPVDVLADAHYYSAEHQMLWEGAFPDARVQLDIPGRRARVNGWEAAATVVATVTGDTWTWAWADPHLPPTAAANLRRFGLDHGVLDLVRPRVPARPELVNLAKPVLGVWTHTYVQLNSETRAVVLLDAPPLALPGPDDPRTTRAVEATLRAPVPAGVDEQRARAAYAQRRGVSLPRSPE